MTDAQRLEDARQARHAILLGQHVDKISVDVDGETKEVQYNKSNLDALERYIIELEAIVEPHKRRRGCYR